MLSTMHAIALQSTVYISPTDLKLTRRCVIDFDAPDAQFVKHVVT